MANAADNSKQSPEMDSIVVTIDPQLKEISVYNNGCGIPVKKLQNNNVYLPESIFLCVYNTDVVEECKATSAKFGGGAKLTNILTTKFLVETVDGSLTYKQVIFL